MTWDDCTCKPESFDSGLQIRAAARPAFHPGPYLSPLERFQKPLRICDPKTTHPRCLIGRENQNAIFLSLVGATGLEYPGLSKRARQEGNNPRTHRGGAQSKIYVKNFSRHVAL